MTTESVRGAEDFLKLSKALKAAGLKTLRTELNRSMSAAARPLIPDVKRAAEADLPRQGGLNQRIAKKQYRAQTRTGEKTAGVRITGAGVEPRIDKEGRVWHPVYGRRPGVVQQIPSAKGYFSETIAARAPLIRENLQTALEDFAERIVHEVQ